MNELPQAPSRYGYFSISQHFEKHFSKCSDGWTEKTYLTISEIPQKIFKESFWTPIIYQHGKRKSANFQYADLLALDFDEGKPTLCEAKELFGNFEGVIYTTKHHQKTKNGDGAYDRFRVVLRLSRKISLSEWKNIQLLCHELFGSCKKCGDGARMFAGGGVNSEITYLTGDKFIDVDELSINFAPPEEKKLLQNIALDTDADYDPALKTKLEAWYRKKKRDEEWNNSLPDTHAKVFSLLNYAFSECPSPSTVYATVKTIGFVRSWLLRHPHQMCTLHQQVKKAYSTWLGEGHQKIKPKNEVMVIPERELPRLPDNFMKNLRSYCQNENIPYSCNFELTSRLLNYNTDNGILALPCGSGKSLVANVQALTYGITDSPIWIVKETLDATVKAKETLDKYSNEVGCLLGFREFLCTKGYTDKEWKKMYSSKSSPCLKCKDAGRCLYAQSLINPNEEMSKPIVVLTHQRLLTLWEQEKIPANVRILIDEQLQRWESIVIEKDFPRRLMTYVQQDISSYLRKKITQFEDACAGGGVAKVKISPRKDDLYHKIKVAGSYRGCNYLNPIYDDVFSILQFISYSKSIYVTLDGDNLRLARDRMLVDIPNKMTILDASAELSHMEWQGFKILKTHEMTVSYPNLHLHPIKSMPTKKAIRKNADNLLEMFSDCNSGETKALFTNKNTALDKLTKNTDSLENSTTIFGQRGQIIGSNEYRTCSSALLCMSVFTSIADYALKTAMSEGNSISADRIWITQNNGKRKPRMNQYGFVDSGLHDAFKRSFVHELYQTILRCNIRANPNAECHIYLLIDHVDTLSELTKWLPDFHIKTNEETHQDFVGWDYLREHYDKSKNYSQLCRSVGFQKNGRNMNKIKELLKSTMCDCAY